MTTLHNSRQQKRDLKMRSENWWVQPLLIGVIVIGLFLLLIPREEVRPPADKPESTVARQEPAATPPPDGAQKTSLGPVDSHFALGRPLLPPPPEDSWTTGRHTESQPQQVEPPQH